MRARMDRERPSRSAWDIKLAPGGFVDIEFAAQALQLTATNEAVIDANTGEALEKLTKAGAVTADVATRLDGAWRLLSTLQQTLRIAVSGDFSLETAPRPLIGRLVALADVISGEELETVVRATQAAVRADFLQIVGDGMPPAAR